MFIKKKKPSEYPNTLKNHLLLPESDLNNSLMFIIILVALGWEGVWSLRWHPSPILSLGMRWEPGSWSLLALISTFLILITPFPKVTFSSPLTSPLHPSVKEAYSDSLWTMMLKDGLIGERKPVEGLIWGERLRHPRLSPCHLLTHLLHATF